MDRSKRRGQGERRQFRRPKRAFNELTTREVEILQVLLKQAPKNRQMGDLLCLSTKTIEYHLHHIYGKLGVHSRGEAIVKATHMGIVPDPDV